LLHFLTKRGYEDKMAEYLSDWGRALAGGVRIVHYEDEPRAEQLDGTCIFSSLDRLDEGDTVRAEELWEALAARGGARRLLNHPRRTLRRRELLAELAGLGVNRFRIYPAEPLPAAPRFPVYLRLASRHTGARSPLLHTREQMESAVSDAVERGLEVADLIFVEFLDTADEEHVYRKYGAFVVGERILPKHVAFSSDWMTKRYDLRGPARLAEELAYLEANPHEERLRELARLAAVRFGRFDYAVLDGEIQVWEINTNPGILSRASELRPHQMANHRWFAERIETLFAELATGAVGTAPDGQRR
jgi:hypothetical protein